MLYFERNGDCKTVFLKWMDFRAEICQKFGWLFWRFEDTKNSFWDQLTFSNFIGIEFWIWFLFDFLKYSLKPEGMWEHHYSIQIFPHFGQWELLYSNHQEIPIT